MNKKIMNKKNYIIAGIVAFIFLIIFSFSREYLMVSPFDELPYEGIIYATLDNEGNTYVLDKAGQRLLKVSPDNRLIWKKEAFSGLFNGIKKVVTSNDHIFLLDVESGEGIRIKGESIVELNSRGKAIETVAKFLYSELTIQQHIVGIFPMGEQGIAYIYKTNDNIRLLVPGESETTYPLKGAGIFLRSSAFDSSTGTVYYSTYDGKIKRYVDGVNDKVLYDSTSSDALSIPADLSFSDGKLYATDIGLRSVIVVDTKSDEVSLIEEAGNLVEKEIAYSLNADNGLACVTDYSVKKYLGNNEYDYFVSCKLSSLIVFKSIISKISIVCFILLVVALAASIVIYIFKEKSMYAKIILGIVTGSFIISALLVAVLVPRFQEEITEAFFEKADLVSDLTSAMLPIESLSRLNSADDFMNEDYQEIRNVARNVFLTESENLSDLYCVFYQVVDGMYVMSYSLTDIAGAIYPYDWSIEGSLEEKVLTTKEGERYMSSTSEGEYLFSYKPLINKNGDAVGIIEVGKDMATFRQEVNTMVIDAFINTIAVTVVLILFIIEIVYFVKGRNEYKEKLENGVEGASPMLPCEIMRMVSFLVFFLTNLSTAFLPLYAMEISEKSSAMLAPEIMAAIPLSAEVITGAVFSVLGVNIIEKISEKRTIIISSVLFTGGFVLRIIPNIWALIVGNAIIGVGWGMILLVATLRITNLPEEKRDIGFSQYNVASLNGVNCGVVFGGFLVNWMNYQGVFMISAVFSISMLILTLTYFNDTKTEKLEEDAEEENEPIKVFSFVLNPKVFSLLFMIVAPILMSSYFLNYMYPIISSGYGLSDTYIGYSYLLNGLCVMFFGELLTSFFIRIKRKPEGLLTASLLYALAFFIVIRFESIPALFAALAILGISDSFGLPLQSGYYTELDIVQKYGYDKALGVYNLIINVAQSIGPFVFSYVLIAGMGRGLTIVLITLVVLAFIFIFIGKTVDKKRSTV
ncbi:MFS transporter [Butyrivibrio sp. WCE2006]|uniref:MFS transporter n=1 Tax=Butyrivibrio sp. WCE2006 TaxID=1410611 RepID=UPI0005D19BB8|nr:MFS transporter [Butyrivibrio sp. WCE2006]